MQIMNLDDSTFDAGMAGITSRLVMLDFWADWCHPCKALAPIVAQFAADHPDVQVVKVDANAAVQTGLRFGVTNLPAILFIDMATGNVVADIRGNANARMLAVKLEQARGLVA